MLKTKSIVRRIALLSALILSFSSFNLYAAAAEGGPAPTDESSSDGESGADRGTNTFVDPNLPGKIFNTGNHLHLGIIKGTSKSGPYIEPLMFFPNLALTYSSI